MTPTERAELAMHQLVLARIAGNARDIEYWLYRVDYAERENIKPAKKKRALNLYIPEHE